MHKRRLMQQPTKLPPSCRRETATRRMWIAKWRKYGPPAPLGRRCGAAVSSTRTSLGRTVRASSTWQADPRTRWRVILTTRCLRRLPRIRSATASTTDVMGRPTNSMESSSLLFAGGLLFAGVSREHIFIECVLYSLSCKFALAARTQYTCFL
jgi:hypothetical protein